MSSQQLCHLYKMYLPDHPEEYLQLMDKGRVICLKCGRLANKKSYVCKPQKIKSSKKKKKHLP